MGHLSKRISRIWTLGKLVFEEMDIQEEKLGKWILVGYHIHGCMLLRKL